MYFVQENEYNIKTGVILVLKTRVRFINTSHAVIGKRSNLSTTAWQAAERLSWHLINKTILVRLQQSNTVCLMRVSSVEIYVDGI